MNNIERRRKKRKIVPLAILGAVVILAVVAVLFFVLRSHSPREDNSDALPSETVLQSILPAVPTSAVATAEPASSPESTTGSTPEAILPTDAPQTSSEPDTTEDAAPTPVQDIPVRISEEQSCVMLDLDCYVNYAADGSPFVEMHGRLAVTFVNNTDRVFYTAELQLGNIKVSEVLLNGVRANRSFSGGVLTVPLFNELSTDGSAELYIEFASTAKLGDSILLPALTYDSGYYLSALIGSNIPLSFTGCSASRSSSGGSLYYSIDETVKSPSFTFAR